MNAPVPVAASGELPLPVGAVYQPDLRPLGFGDILDGAFVLYRRNFAAFLAMSALPLAPVLACQLLLAAGGVDDARIWFLLTITGGFLTVLAMGALIRATADAYGGTPVDTRRALAMARARYWTQLRAGLVAGLVTMVGFLFFIVPGIMALVNYFAVNQAAVLEDTTPSQARHRSSHLSNGAGGRILGMVAVLTVITWLPVVSQGVIAEWLGSEYADSGLAAVGEQLLQILALPLTTAACTLLYFDRRVRVDAMDVQAAMQRMALEG